MTKRIILSVMLATALLCQSCVKDDTDPMATEKPYSRVLTIMCLGNNNGLAASLKDNIKTICDNPVPLKTDPKAILIYEHYDNQAPILTRLYSDWRGSISRDTLLTLSKETVSTSVETMVKVLSYVQEEFQSDHYGLILSSHGTGWLPKSYYTYFDGNGPRVSSFGAEGGVTSPDAAEIELTDLPHCIPFHCDYIIFDACLMGGVEVAYEMKDVTDKIAFSATEILARGYQYDVLLSDVMKNSDYALEDFCSHFYEFTQSMSSPSDRSCTISCVRTDKLEALAAICKPLFSKYRDQLMHLGPDDVQGFYRYNKQWFFDLEDMLVKAGVSSGERDNLEKAIKECVTYCNHTDGFLPNDNGFKIDTYCGLSSYLTGAGNDYLDGVYTYLAWNKATEYVVMKP